MTMEKTFEEYDEDGDSLQVEKRDGRIVDFDGENIRHAIDMALRETEEDVPQKDETVERIVNEVRNAIVERYTQPVHIEDIQTLIEHGIINAGWYDTARRYTQYRLDKDIERSKAADVDHAVEMLIRKDSSIVKENANKDSNVYSTQRDLLAGAVSKAKAFSMLPKAVANAHMKGDIHFHDADYSPFTAQSNCFSRDTRFITDKGVKSFEDFDNGDEITVLTPSGKWNKAVVHSYGVKTLNDITFVRNGRTRRTIRATADHRWILRHGEETTSLSVGDVLLYPPVHKTVLSEESDKNILEAWAKGFVHGDGSESEQRKKDGEYHCTLRHSWKVESIEQNTGTEETWCLEVENEHAFVLEGGITTGNCSLPNFENMLKYGFALGNATMDSPRSISTAATQITQIIKDIASSQYGGQTVNRADELLEEYARKDYDKNLRLARSLFKNGSEKFLSSMIVSLKEQEPESLHFEDDRAPIPDDIPFTDDASEIEKLREVYAKIQTRKAIYDAMQTMEYQINSNRVSNGQTPFVTVGFGLGTSWFAREIQRSIFLNRIRGLGHDHLTAIFPKLVFTIRHGVNADEGDPNYDMKQLALECATKRMYPDVVFYENIKKITGGGFRAPMGAVAGDEVITWSDGETVRTEGFERMWSRLTSRFSPQHQGTDGDDWFIDLDAENVSIKDSHQGSSRFVKVRRIISNQSRDWWKRVIFNGGRVVDCTSDHPFEVSGKGRIFAEDLAKGDVIDKSVDAADYDKSPILSVSSVESIQKDARSYDVTTESDYFDVSGIVSHNCRSFLQTWINPDTGEEENEGRMNLGVVTVNIPRIALESRGNRRKFWKIFEERLNVAHEALSFRVARCKEARPINAPTLYQNGAFGRLKKDDDVDSLFNRERATVSLGYIGLYEATSVFFGKDWMRDHDWDEDGKKFALSIVRRMKKRCKEWSENEGYWFSVYGTPAESLTDRFNRLDRKKFGKVEGVTDHDFYTNSFHYPVWLSPTPFEKLKFEEDFPHYASGGFINYCEFPTLQTNPKALEAVWDYGYDIGIGYLGTNTPIDRCFRCGFEGDFEPTDEGFKCPECGNHDPDQCDVTKRTCGYLGNPVQRPMVHGRHDEIAHRVKHMSGETGHVILKDGSEKEWFAETK